MEPEKFAAELISRLEGVLREREAQEKLEERLKRVRLVSAFQVMMVRWMSGMDFKIYSVKVNFIFFNCENAFAKSSSFFFK